MNNIKVLDCTLRDGGYVNNWEFGTQNIKCILELLSESNLDYIEAGFLVDIENYNGGSTRFSNLNQLKALVGNFSSQKFCLMINYGEYDVENIPQNNSKNLILRVAFKKDKVIEAIEYCNVLKNKGYDIFVNPMVTDSYTDEELVDLISLVNKLKPLAFTVADTLGEMLEADIEKIFGLIDKNLDQQIALCFHSHNNMQHSFGNVQKLIQLCQQRELIIDSSVFGIGRGAGNLCTELITQHINKLVHKYNTVNILEVAKEFIMPIYEKTPWGYSAEYYLSALNHCHPNYAKYLRDKELSGDEINKIFQSIPDDKKATFSFELIKSLLNK